MCVFSLVYTAPVKVMEKCSIVMHNDKMEDDQQGDLDLYLDPDWNVDLDSSPTWIQTWTLAWTGIWNRIQTLTVNQTNPNSDLDPNFFPVSHLDSDPYPDSDLDQVGDQDCDRYYITGALIGIFQ